MDCKVMGVFEGQPACGADVWLCVDPFVDGKVKGIAKRFATCKTNVRLHVGGMVGGVTDAPIATLLTTVIAAG